MWPYGPWGWFPWMWIFPLFCFAVLLVFLFGWGDWPMGRGTRDRDREETAREILDRRYARGEISREEYQQMKKDLG